MEIADNTILAAAFPDAVLSLLRDWETNPELREMCADFLTMARLAAEAPSDAAVRENLVALKAEILCALARAKGCRTK